MNELNLEILNLFQEKRYSELIFLIENLNENKNPKLLNILAVSRLLKEKNQQSFLKAISEFKKAYLLQRNENVGLESLTNFINASVDFYDYLVRQRIEDNKLNFNEIIKFFEDAKIEFGYRPQLFLSMARLYKRLNDLDKVLYFYNKLYEKNNLNFNSLSSWIFYNNYKKDWKQEQYLKFSKLLANYASSYETDKLVPIQNSGNSKTRLGFLSADIVKKHSVTYFLKTILTNYDKNKFEIYLYINEEYEDETTSEFKKLVDKCINIAKLNDVDAINKIRKDRIDVAFDLMGITASNRYTLFKNKLAKKQISWLGYCNTLGLNQIDYLIADPNLIYSSEEKLYSEKIIYLKNIWSCHSGFVFNRNETPSPMLRNNFITFGSFNNFSKINNNVVEVWANILKKIEGSQLILKSSQKKEIENLKTIFKKNNVLNSVLFLENTESFKEHLDLYDKIDIALDTFPYNGVTTSFEAIWKNVPVITMKGYNFNSRCGESINKNLGIEELIAKNEEDYMNISINLAFNKSKLNNIRKKIFNDALSSPLFNSELFCKNFFNAIDNLK